MIGAVLKFKEISAVRTKLVAPSLPLSQSSNRVRDEFGIEAAQALAGHSSPSMTAHYASKMDGLAAKMAAKIG